MSLKYTDNFETTSGTIRGYYQDEEIMVFKGVPYAEAPVGDRRWKEAQKYAPREGVLDCVEFGRSEWQEPLEGLLTLIWTEEFTIQNLDYSEDCLTLNIWAKEGKKNQPVILYFYGGNFVSGGSACEIYDGTAFAKQDIVYVSFTHREGTLGWYASDELKAESDKGIAGNYMLSDAITVLEWIRDNIAAFGGDPNNVSIWGQSAGASQVALLSVSPVAKNLFTKSLWSGINSYAHMFWRPLDQICEQGNELAKEFGGSLAKMREVPAGEFVPHYPGSSPAIDGYYVDRTFAEYVNQGTAGDGPLLIGFVKQDWKVTKMAVRLNASADSIEKIKAILEEYFPGKVGTILASYFPEGADLPKAVERMMMDYFLKGLLDFSQANQKYGGGRRLYIYLMNHVMPGPHSAKIGAFHSSDVPYYMNHLSDKRDEYWQPEDREIARLLNEDTANFVKYGKTKREEFAPSTGLNLFVINSEESHNEIIPEERYQELVRIFG